MATTTDSPAPKAAGKKNGKTPGQPIIPTTPPLIVRVGISVLHTMPQGCTRRPAPLLVGDPDRGGLADRQPGPGRDARSQAGGGHP